VQGQLGLAILLETCFLQHWFNLSDPGVEEAFHDSRTFRR
jgi:IS5 family transposase